MEAALGALMTSGLPGVFVVILSLCVAYLYKEGQKRENTLREAHLGDLRSVMVLTESVKIQIAAMDMTLKSLVEWLKLKENR